jgi:protein-tyrosine phosphatase
VSDLESTAPDGAYWVIPGRLLAGIYPDEEILPDVVAADVDVFIDLTEEDELDPYEADIDGRPYRRFPIPDLGTPSPELMREILDELDAALDEGLTVYVHCRGGIGRTGTVVGCWLVRGGRSGEEAIATIAELRGDAFSPETREQHAFVRAWED